MIDPDAGRILFNGKDVTALPMYQRARLGMGYLWQEKSVFRRLTVEQNILAILEAIMGLAHAFKREVIAEGVEEVEHGSLLLELGCEVAQGYGIARPMPAEEIPSWAASWRPPAAWLRAQG